MPNKFNAFCSLCNKTVEFTKPNPGPQILREWAMLALKPRSALEALVKSEGTASLGRCSVCDSVLFVCKQCNVGFKNTGDVGSRCPKCQRFLTSDT